ncbi:MAG: site-2 protease family protein [Acidobacteria bacterium]|nr:site-2 protease family protein [Acidobacteriota bacterium]
MQVPEAPTPVAARCPGCGTEVAPSFLSCPACQRLVHAEPLKRLAADAEAARQGGDLRAALGAWREALELLPAESRQFGAVSARISALAQELDRHPAAEKAKGRAWAKGAAGVGALGLLLWKLKAVLLFALTKGKLLLLGLTKTSTLLSMLLSLGVYWAAWGWTFAAGLVASIYVHEMGHVAMLRHYGIRATAPMFIPGLGAMIRLKQSLPDARQDARVGLAGPMWGFGAAAVCALVSVVTGWASFAALARVGAWINLFNLLPVWQLDGGRGFHALSRSQRWGIATVMGAMWAVTHEGLFALLVIASVGRAIGRSTESSDRLVFFQFVFLIVALSLLLLTPVRLVGAP